MLATLPRPDALARYDATDYYFTALMGFLEKVEGLEFEPDTYHDLLWKLPDHHAGYWRIVEAAAARSRKVSGHAEAQLRAYFEADFHRVDIRAGTEMKALSERLAAALRSIAPGNDLLMHSPDLSRLRALPKEDVSGLSVG